MEASRRGGRPRALSPEQVETAQLLRATGSTYADIANQLGAARETVRDAVARAGTRVPEHPPAAPDPPSDAPASGNGHPARGGAETAPTASPPMTPPAPAPRPSAVRSLEQIRSHWARDEASDPGSAWYPPSLPLRPVYPSERIDLS